MKKSNYSAVILMGILCFLGSFINTMGFIKYSSPVSNVTGIFVKGIYSILEGRMDIFKYIMTIPVVFLVGSIISGVFFSKKVSDLNRKYAIYLLFLGSFLSLSTLLFRGENYFLYFLALVTGMQNGMYLNYKGIICRTTHMTGTITDLGATIGNIIVGNRDNQENNYKLHYCFINIGGCMIGMMAGGMTYNQFQDQGLYLPALGYILIGLTFFRNKVSV
ncbi:MAG: YoaK family protein [Fusobacteriaceae bacterium]